VIIIPTSTSRKQLKTCDLHLNNSRCRTLCPGAHPILIHWNHYTSTEMKIPGELYKSDVSVLALLKDLEMLFIEWYLDVKT